MDKWDRLQAWLDDPSTDTRLGAHARVIVLDVMNRFANPPLPCDSCALARKEGERWICPFDMQQNECGPRVFSDWKPRKGTPAHIEREVRDYLQWKEKSR